MANPFLETFLLSVRVTDDVCRSTTANLGPQYPEKYKPHLFHFLENDYLDDKLQKCEIRIFHFIYTLTKQHYHRHEHGIYYYKIFSQFSVC